MKQSNKSFFPKLFSKKAQMVLLLIMFLVVLSFGVKADWNVSNTQATYTFNNSGMIVGIYPKDFNKSIILPSDSTKWGAGDMGLSYYTNTLSAWNDNSPNQFRQPPGRNAGRILVNTSTEIRMIQNLSRHRIEYHYLIYPDRLDINVRLERNVTTNATVSLDYMVDFNIRNTNHTPTSRGTSIVYKPFSQIYSYNDDIIGRGYTRPGLEHMFIYNDSFGLLFVVKSPAPYGATPFNDVLDRFRFYPSLNVPFDYVRTSNLFGSFTKGSNKYNITSQYINFSLIFNKDYGEAYRDIYNLNITKSYRNISLSGGWLAWNYCMDSTLTQDDLDRAKKNGVKWVSLGSWDNNKGNLDSFNGTWRRTNKNSDCGQGTATFITSQINLIKSNGLYPFLYINIVELNKTIAWNDFRSDVVINQSLRNATAYTIYQTLMSFDNPYSVYYRNVTKRFQYLLAEYPNITGIYFDRLDYNTENTNGTLTAHYMNISVDSKKENRNFSNNMMDGYYNIISNLTSQSKNNGKLVFGNSLRSMRFIKGLDAILHEGIYKDSYRIGSMDKYIYSLPVTVTQVSNINHTIEWGVFMGWDTNQIRTNNLTSDEIFLINKTANERLIRYYPTKAGTDQTYIEFSNLITTNQSTADITTLYQGTYDWYYLNNHTVVKHNSKYYNKTSLDNKYTAVYILTQFDRYELKENDDLADAINGSNIVFDWRVPIWFTSSSNVLKKIASNLSSSVPATISLNVAGCNLKNIVINYPDGTSKNLFDYSYRCENSIVTVQNVPIMPSADSNEIRIEYWMQETNPYAGGSSGSESTTTITTTSLLVTTTLTPLQSTIQEKAKEAFQQAITNIKMFPALWVIISIFLLFMIYKPFNKERKILYTILSVITLILFFWKYDFIFNKASYYVYNTLPSLILKLPLFLQFNVNTIPHLPSIVIIVLMALILYIIKKIVVMAK